MALAFERSRDQEFTRRYTQQQNGVAERENRTIMEMARSMLKAKNLSNDFWAEAVACAIYILNRNPTKSVKDRIPQEAWIGGRSMGWKKHGAKSSRTTHSTKKSFARSMIKTCRASHSKSR